MKTNHFLVVARTLEFGKKLHMLELGLELQWRYFQRMTQNKIKALVELIQS